MSGISCAPHMNFCNTSNLGTENIQNGKSPLPLFVFEAMSQELTLLRQAYRKIWKD
jgi:hypothetical protein